MNLKKPEVLAAGVLEPLEAMNGTLAFGLNTAVLFAILANLARKHSTSGEFFR